MMAHLAVLLLLLLRTHIEAWLVQCSGIINAVVDKVLNASPSNICKLLGKC